MESQKIQGKCFSPNCDALQTRRNKYGFKKYCTNCSKNPYARLKKSACEECGFVPVHSGQLEVDHIDGDHSNNIESNLKTLCANCHRLKTIVNKNWF
ncbi:HNH endonuclease [Salmonella enterica]|nr:HNH endonuclease [Salmonella enterica]MLU53265.1 HNH endonuclease [Salmonella enterica subsp. enterica serovar Bareilly]